MKTKYKIIDFSEKGNQTDSNVIILVTKDGQPFEIISKDPVISHTVNQKTTVVLSLPEDDVDQLQILEMAKLIAYQELYSQGVILMRRGEITDILPSTELLLGIDLTQSRDFFALGKETGGGNIRTRIVYSCPYIDCPSSDWYLWQKGMDVPKCPVHNVPRVLREEKK